MKTSMKGLLELATSEGVALRKYKDTQGVWTIAIGATASEIPDLASWRLDREITLVEAFALFQSSIKKYEKAVNNAIKRDITQYQFDALVSICYNIGTQGLTNSTFVKRINARADQSSIRSAIMMWTKNKELIGRRTREADLYLTGQYTSKGFIQLINGGAKRSVVDARQFLIEEAVEAPQETIEHKTPIPTVKPAKQPDGSEWADWIKKILLGF